MEQELGQMRGLYLGKLCQVDDSHKPATMLVWSVRQRLGTRHILTAGLGQLFCLLHLC